MKFKLLAGAALAAVFTASGAAAQEPGWYGAVDLGYHTPDAGEMTSSNNSAAGAPYTWDLKQKDDWAGFARLGYQLNDHWRVELEGGYRSGDVDSFRGGANQVVTGLCTPGVLRTAAAPNCGAPTGSIVSWTVMGNVIYDIMPDSAINPFVGAGVGINHVKADAIVGQFSNVTGVVSATNPGIQNLTVNDDDSSFAWQLLGGLAWKATDRLNVDLTYRYLSGADMSLASRGTSTLQPGDFTGRYSDQSVTVGLRYSFAAAPPPPPPPPAYEAKQFIVYFPFDQFVLTPEAQTVVSEAANYANAGHATRVIVVGHTDTSGSPAYNVRLSERRAKAVADALVGLSVPQTALQVDWKGETMLAVPTADGVKEPLNRRSTIDINF
ncbi:OmpA family protein [Phenylobacterium aquaticum]|uniref:OmpA family protein n=1 Tax=Phenylobacterium aquaticum TaxID=1763816 RepID=UPI0026F28CAB|nr:OmpA family protein [Phenylobacterium aquaticum]